jgi:hypothetical protein
MAAIIVVDCNSKLWSLICIHIRIRIYINIVIPKTLVNKDKEDQVVTPNLFFYWHHN